MNSPSRSTVTYICGPHGAGKSTLIRRLVEHQSSLTALPRLPLRLPPDIRPFPRVATRVLAYSLEWHMHHGHIQRQTAHTFIGDRCIVDSLIYANAFNQLGWLSDHEHAWLHDLARRWANVPPRLILLAPPLTMVQTHLAVRWTRSAPGWRERDFTYLQAVHQSYLDFAVDTAEQQRYGVQDLLLIAHSQPSTWTHEASTWLGST